MRLHVAEILINISVMIFQLYGFILHAHLWLCTRERYEKFFR